MALNKQSGNMYGFVTHTWNAIKGQCSHNCSYCYMKRFPQNPIRLDEKEFKTDLGKGNFIFVGSSTDMFADDVPSEWIRQVLDHCKHYMNTYLFQTKNPKRFKEFKNYFPLHCIFGITLETNRENNLENCPPRSSRVGWMEEKWLDRKMVTIEPIMDFDVAYMSYWIERINPEFVNIGADSNRKKDYSIPEPTEFKIQNLIKKLELFTKVNLKPNLDRLYSSPTSQTQSLRDCPNEEHNISLKDNSNELSQISSNDETSLNNNIKRNKLAPSKKEIKNDA